MRSMFTTVAISAVIRTIVATQVRKTSWDATGMLSLRAKVDNQDQNDANVEREMFRSRDEQMTKVWMKIQKEGRQAPWKAATTQYTDPHGRNLCMEGKQVPDFYVLGVQKCATSSLADNLMEAGIANVHGDRNPKEFHWFDHRMDFETEGDEGIAANRKEWLQWMPDCPVNKTSNVPTRKALADFTPDYFRVVPRPKEFKFTNRWWLQFQTLEVVGPEKMLQMYGKEHAKKLHFALMVREPLSQMQSAWYHAREFNFTNACRSCVADSFKDALVRDIKGLKRKKPLLSPWVWTTLYARQMEHWLEFFDPSQFYIIPMKQLTGQNKDSICSDLSNRLQFMMQCDSAGVESVHAWSHDHPPVKEDAGDLRKEFDEIMEKENRRFVSLLTKAHAAGMGLANYKGTSNPQTIKEWLEGSW